MKSSIPSALIDRIVSCGNLVAFTGAGISAESGVPTFRGNEGIWKKFKSEELANVSAFMRNPELVWEWYSARRRVIAEVQPNDGHRAIAAFQDLIPSVTVVTQNIDNLHRRAGSRTVFELHGNIERNYCMQCLRKHDDHGTGASKKVPRCPECGGLVRPDVVWFGEMLPTDQWDGSVEAMEGADVVLSVGTSGVVYPAAGLPFHAGRNGAYLVEINIEPTDLTGEYHAFIPGPSGIILPEILSAVRSRLNS